MTFLKPNPYNVNCAFIDVSVYILVWCIEVFSLTYAVSVCILIMMVVRNSCCFIFLGDFSQAKISTKAFNVENR